MAARRVAVSVGVTVGLTLVAETIAGLDQVPPAAHGVLLLPVYVLMAYLFWRASRLLRADIAERADDEVPGFQGRALTLVANILVVLAVIGPALAAIGYINATQAVMVPTALSLALIGLLLTLQPVVRDLYAVVLRTTPEAAGDALIPVLVNFLLVFASLPLLALIWGARPRDAGRCLRAFLGGVVHRRCPDHTLEHPCGRGVLRSGRSGDATPAGGAEIDRPAAHASGYRGAHGPDLGRGGISASGLRPSSRSRRAASTSRPSAWCWARCRSASASAFRMSSTTSSRASSC